MDSYRPPSKFWDDGPPKMPDNVKDTMYHFRGSASEAPISRGSHYHSRSGKPGTSIRRPLGISQRPLLRLRNDLTEKRIYNPNARDKFRNLDEVTDSEEDEMAESDEDMEMPTAKRTKVEDVSETARSTPKWSNPDPYTALPPPTETSGKRTDVVKLIRKAKISDAKKDDSEAENSYNDDFISFDLDPGERSPSPSPPIDAPTGPRVDLRGGGRDGLGKRKRGYDDALPHRSRSTYGEHNSVSILQEWQASPHANPTPWLRPVHSDGLPGIALHKEIIDFYNWVQPTEYEAEVRDDVLKRLTIAFNRIEPGELKAFGSYAAGLYLPTGDMDLVYLQRSFRPGLVGFNGLPPPPTKTLLHRFANFLRTHSIAKPGTVLMISSAKVPIIKFVERVSGLKIDLSFNNDSGLIANETFQRWKEAYPAMPVLVSIVKQYLMIRGLNDVSIGGLGGFSTICLVTSLIQHMPLSNSPPNLGELLVEFFNLYGNLLDKQTVAIRLDPPGYIDKETYKPHLFNNEKKGRLTIIDPNRPENNISGGSHEINRIVACFSIAHDVLQDRLSAYAASNQMNKPFSFLKDLVGGDFTAYDAQRNILRDLYFGLTGKEAPAVVPPPPPPISEHTIPLPPSIQHEPQSKTAKSEVQSNGVPTNPFDLQKPTKNQRRAHRLKLARPELAMKIKSTISSVDAIRIGGYEDADAMEKDLQAKLGVREK